MMSPSFDSSPRFHPMLNPSQQSHLRLSFRFGGGFGFGAMRRCDFVSINFGHFVGHLIYLQLLNKPLKIPQSHDKDYLISLQVCLSSVPSLLYEEIASIAMI